MGGSPDVPPAPPPPPPPDDLTGKPAMLARDRAKQKAMMAAGFSSTIFSGGRTAGSQILGVPTLLGK